MAASNRIDNMSLSEDPDYMEVYPDIHHSPIEKLGNIINKDRHVHFGSNDDKKEKKIDESDKSDKSDNKNEKSELMFGLISKKLFWTIITGIIILIVIIVGFMWWRQRGNKNKLTENPNQGIPGPPGHHPITTDQAFLPNGYPIPRILPNGMCLIGNNPVSPEEYNQYLQQFNMMMSGQQPHTPQNSTNGKKKVNNVSKEKLNNIKNDLDDLTDSDDESDIDIEEDDDDYDLDSVISSSINEIEEEKKYANKIKELDNSSNTFEYNSVFGDMNDMNNMNNTNGTNNMSDNKTFDNSSKVFEINTDSSPFLLDDNDITDNIIDNMTDNMTDNINSNKTPEKICKGFYGNGNKCTNKAKFGDYCGRHDPNKDQI